MAIKAESCIVRKACILEPRGEFQANFVAKTMLQLFLTFCWQMQMNESALLGELRNIFITESAQSAMWSVRR